LLRPSQSKAYEAICITDVWGIPNHNNSLAAFSLKSPISAQRVAFESHASLRAARIHVPTDAGTCANPTSGRRRTFPSPGGPPHLTNRNYIIILNSGSYRLLRSSMGGRGTFPCIGICRFGTTCRYSNKREQLRHYYQGSLISYVCTDSGRGTTLLPDAWFSGSILIRVPRLKTTTFRFGLIPRSVGLFRRPNEAECIAAYLFSHTLTQAFKAYAGQKKSKSRTRGLSHLSRPPDLLNPRNRRIKEKEKHLIATSPSNESEWHLDGVRLGVRLGIFF
jgi:hypothetical protein